MARERAEGALGVVDNDHGQRIFAAVARIDQRSHRAGIPRLGEKRMRVEAIAAQGDEEVALRDRARVGRHAAEARFRATHATLEHLRELGDVHHAAPLRTSAARAVSASENGSRRPRISWYASWPFPAISTTSACAAPAMASSIAVARAGWGTCSPGMPFSICAMIASRASPR